MARARHPGADRAGRAATGLFLPPAALICFLLLRKHRREAGFAGAAARAGRDRLGAFAALTGIEVLRSAAFFGLNTFIELYFAVLVKLGQDYLPTRPVTAAGVTLGLGVGVGGLTAPLLGLVASAHGPRGALLALLVLPPLALLCGTLLRDP